MNIQLPAGVLATENGLIAIIDGLRSRSRHVHGRHVYSARVTRLRSFDDCIRGPAATGAGGCERTVEEESRTGLSTLKFEAH